MILTRADILRGPRRQACSIFNFLVQALKFVPQVLAHALLQLKQRHDESESASCEGSVDMAQDENKPLAMDDKSHQSARSDFDDPLIAVSPRLTAVAKSKEELYENPSG